MRRRGSGRGEQVSKMLSVCQLMIKTSQTTKDKEKLERKAAVRHWVRWSESERT